MASFVHNITCDSCKTPTIVGTRYKCGKCPDFDVCQRCFPATLQRHGAHDWIRIKNPEDHIMTGQMIQYYSNRTIHQAICDSCQNPIVGPRFKCMHPSCPDFDLCENCEALPQPVHPTSHPFLKLKNAIDTYQGIVSVPGANTTYDKPTYGGSEIKRYL